MDSAYKEGLICGRKGCGIYQRCCGIGSRPGPINMATPSVHSANMTCMRAQEAPVGCNTCQRKRWATRGMTFGGDTNKYQVDQFVADSTYIVYECHAVDNPNKQYVVKIYDPQDIKGARADFDADVRSFEHIKPCMYNGRNLIVEKIDHFANDTNGCHFLVMEKIKDPESAQDLLEEIIRMCGLDEDVARDVFLQVLAAIDCVHSQHYIHRDLKTDNVLIESSNIRADGKKYYNVKVTDFGLARPVDTKIAAARTNKGTDGMKAPEIMDNKGLYHGKAVDMWGLGVILYTMVTGEKFPGPGIAKRGGGELNLPSGTKFYALSEGLQDLIAKLLRWEADPEGFQARIAVEECKTHPWLTPKRSLGRKQSFAEQKLDRTPTWTKDRPVVFCQCLQVKQSDCDGCFLQTAELYTLAYGIESDEFVKSRCLGAASECDRQVLSVVSNGVLVQRTQPKAIIRDGDTLFYGVAGGFWWRRPNKLELHDGFEGRLCRKQGVRYGLMQCVKFEVKAHMDECVIGGPQHRGETTQGWIRFRNNYGGLTIALVKKCDGTEVFFPGPNVVLHQGDVLYIPRRFMEDDATGSPMDEPTAPPNWREPEDELTKVELDDEQDFENKISRAAMEFEDEGHFKELVRTEGAALAGDRN